MTVQPSVLLLIDLSAVMAGSIREWQEYWRVGQCYLPQVVYEEIQFLCTRAPEPTQEQTAREFVRFFFNGGWHLTTTHATHPTLTPASGQAISKRARLSLATAECAYGLSQEHQDKLVVFVANNQTLLHKIKALGVSNLCSITATMLLQWSRTGQSPPSVIQQMETMSKAVGSLLTTPKQRVTSTSSRPAFSPPPMTRPASASRMQVSSRQRATAGSPSQLIRQLLALVGIAIASLIMWRIIQPASFNQVWQHFGFPIVPGQPQAKPQKPVTK